MKVVIVGGGWAGCAAAISARKQGAEVSLLERTDMLLGCGLVGGHHAQQRPFHGRRRDAGHVRRRNLPTHRSDLAPPEHRFPGAPSRLPVQLVDYRARRQETSSWIKG